MFNKRKQEKVYTPTEKAELAEEFSPALAEVLETIAPAWGNKVKVLSNKVLDIVERETPEVNN